MPIVITCTHSGSKAVYLERLVEETHLTKNVVDTARGTDSIVTMGCSTSSRSPKAWIFEPDA